MVKDALTEDVMPIPTSIPRLVEATPTAEPTITAVTKTWNHMCGTKEGRCALITPRVTLKPMGWEKLSCRTKATRATCTSTCRQPSTFCNESITFGYDAVGAKDQSGQPQRGPIPHVWQKTGKAPRHVQRKGQQ
eukprot:scaffold122311_cov63-Phaeocystis_antarctica.AAC.4